jgi:hypothetical protein
MICYLTAVEMTYKKWDHCYQWYHVKACLNTFQMSPNVMGFQWSRKVTNIFCILILVTYISLKG